MAEQWLQPVTGRQAVRVHERNQLTPDRGQSCVARAGRADIDGQPHEGCAVPLGDLLGRGGVDRPIIDNDARQPLEREEQSLELSGPVAHRDDDRHVVGAQVAPGRLGGECAGGHQPPSQQLRRATRPDGATVTPPLHQPVSPFGYPEESQGAATQQNGPAVEVLG